MLSILANGERIDMATPGYVYVLVNPSMPGMTKVGKTTKNPRYRASELSSATGVPTPFILVYYESFADCDHAEYYIHSLLEKNGYRVSSSREFFSADVSDIIKLVSAIPGKVGQTDIDSVIEAENLAIDDQDSSFRTISRWDDQQSSADNPDELTEIYNIAVDVVIKEQKVSASLLQRVLRIGYVTASSLIEKMERGNIVSRPDQRGGRVVLAKPR